MYTFQKMKIYPIEKPCAKAFKLNSPFIRKKSPHKKEHVTVV
jgi:hypothetical protein